jgi:hypothetical protein
VMNFDEFVFIPPDPATSFVGKPFDALMRHYYHFAPAPMRQMRAWKNLPGITNIDDAGHRLRGPDIRVYPVNGPFRHFIALGLDHFRKKYRGRKFPANELARGWHHNRANIDVDQVALPPLSALKFLADDHPDAFDRTDPWRHHFWERTF